MKIDWDAMQPPKRSFDWMCSFLWKLHALMGQESPAGAARYVPVLLHHGFSADEYLRAGDAPVEVANALRTPRSHRTTQQHMLIFERLAHYYIWIASADVELYRSWFRLVEKEVPPLGQYQVVHTDGWEHAANI